MKTKGRKIIRFSKYYDSSLSLIPNLSNFYRQTFETINIEKDKNILDLGCGTGTVAIIVSELYPNAKIIGIDASPQMIAIAEKKIYMSESNIDFIIALAEKLPFNDHKFDLIYSFEVFHHLPDIVKNQALNEIFRLLKPNGIFLLNDFSHPDNIILRILVWPLRFSKYFRSNILGILPILVKRSGFKIIKTKKSLGGLILTIISRK